MSQINALDFARNYLRIHQHADFEAVRRAAEKEGIELLPIVFGRAQQLEGTTRVEVDPQQVVRTALIRYYALRVAVLLVVIAAVVWFFLWR